MNQLPNVLHHVVHSVDELTIETLVAASGMREVANSAQFSMCALKLQAMCAIIFHDEQHPSKNLRETVSKELVSLSKNLRKLRVGLDQDENHNIVDALGATSVDLNVARAIKSEAPIEFDRTVAELRVGLEAIAILVDHFFERRDKFDKTKPSFLTADLLLKDEQTLVSDRSLHAYFRKPANPNVPTIIVRTIADIYKRLFGVEFAVTAKSRGGPPRYSGPGIRFACTVVTGLQFSKYFEVGSEIELINKVGDIWTNNRRRKKPSAGRSSSSRAAP